MISFKELQQKKTDELHTLLKEKRTELWNFRFGAAGSKAKNVKEGQGLRKDIARILTALSAVGK